MNRNRLIQTALLASVGLNLFLLGTQVPRWLAPAPPHPPHMMVDGPDGPPGFGGPMIVLRRKMDDLPPADAAILRDHFEGDMEKFVERAKMFRDRIDRLRDLMQADPFDAAALRTELEKAAAERQALERGQTDTVIAVLEKLSPEGRRRLAEMRGPRLLMNEGPGGRGPGMPPPGAIPFDPARAPMAAPPGPAPDMDGER